MLVRKIIFATIITILSIDFICFIINIYGVISNFVMLIVWTYSLSIGTILSLIGAIAPLTSVNNEKETKSLELTDTPTESE